MGYSSRQIADLAATLNAVDADVIVAGTPVDLTRLAQLNKPVVRARYNYADISAPGLGALVDDFIRTPGIMPTNSAG